jgi:hypothetical protein
LWSDLRLKIFTNKSAQTHSILRRRKFKFLSFKLVELLSNVVTPDSSKRAKIKVDKKHTIVLSLASGDRAAKTTKKFGSL